MSEPRKGRRRFDLDGIDSWDEATRPQPGDYWKDSRGEWTALTPNGLLGGLANHDVTEHEDGTITVSPSILTERSGPNPMTYHGYLWNGEWTDA